MRSYIQRVIIRFEPRRGSVRSTMAYLSNHGNAYDILSLAHTSTHASGGISVYAFQVSHSVNGSLNWRKGQQLSDEMERRYISYILPDSKSNAKLNLEFLTPAPIQNKNQIYIYQFFIYNK